MRRWARSHRANVTKRHGRLSGEKTSEPLNVDATNRSPLELDTSVSGVPQPVSVTTSQAQLAASTDRPTRGKEPRMTDTTETAPLAATAAGARRGVGLNAMLLPELKQLAGGLGVKASGMRKGALIEAIKAAQSGGHDSGPSSRTTSPAEVKPVGRPERVHDGQPEAGQDVQKQDVQKQDGVVRR